MKQGILLFTGVWLWASAAVGQIRSTHIEFRELDPESSLRDCAPNVPASDLCRVRRQWNATDLSTISKRPLPMDVKGDSVTFVYEGAADSVDLSGGIQYPLSHLSETRYWTVTLRVPEADRASFSFFFMPMQSGQPGMTTFRPQRFRGKNAPVPALAAKNLRGTIVRDTIASSNLNQRRAVSVYIPPGDNEERVAGVIYVADDITQSVAAALDTLIAVGVLPRIMIVGFASDGLRTTSGQTADNRSLEYLYVSTGDSTRFLAHERFVLREVIPWAESRFHAPADAAHRAFAGVSNGGALAVEMGLRNPEWFGHIIALSPAGRVPAFLPGYKTASPARFYLAGGTFEPSFLGRAKGWNALLRERGIPAMLRSSVGGHDWEVWRLNFIDGVAWAFGSSGYLGTPTWGER